MIVNGRKRYNMHPVPGGRALTLRGMRGLRGTTCDDYGDCYDDGSGGTGGYDDGDLGYVPLNDPFGSSVTDVPTPNGAPDPNAAQVHNLAAQFITQAPSSMPLIGGATVVKSGNGYGVQSSSGSLTSGLTVSQAAQLVGLMASQANSVYKSTQTPYQIPGTSLIYNPATGQMMNAGGGVLGGTGTSMNLQSMMPMILIGAAVLLISVMGKK